MMPASETAKPFIRQDWIREKIQVRSNSFYELQKPEGCFLTRKGVPKGLFILRLKLTANRRSSPLTFRSNLLEEVNPRFNT